MNLKGFARKLRKEPTDAEKKLWRHIRAKQFSGIKFRRQQQIGSYIADFYCAEKKIVIELDGGQHAEGNHDKVRDLFMGSQGIKVIRVWNNEITTNIEGVMEFIKIQLENRIDTYRFLKKKSEDKAECRG